MQYQNIDADLDNGKKCCFCFGLELGFNIIGVFALLNGIYSGIKLIDILSLVSEVGIVIAYSL